MDNMEGWHKMRDELLSDLDKRIALDQELKRKLEECGTAQDFVKVNREIARLLLTRIQG
jgi:hypothetical protein